MDDLTALLQSIKFLFGVFVAPIFGALVWYVKKSINQLDELNNRVSNAEKNLEVLEERVDNMRNDLKEIKEMLRQLLKKAL